MHRFASKSLLFSLPKWKALTVLFRLSNGRFNVPQMPLYCSRYGERTIAFRAQRLQKSIIRATKRSKASKSFLQGEDHAHIMWWQERMDKCKKPSCVQLVKRLKYSNLLGLDESLRSGSLKEGTLNCELLQVKSKFPREVLVCRVGEFYEAVGFDACILVEHAGLNPMSGLRSDTVPRAGCPVMNLRQTLDDLTRSGYSVCIVEEVQGPTQARSRKGRFISGHAHPGSPYVYGLAGADLEVDFPEPVPVVGVSHSAKGYCLISVIETLKTYSIEDGLTEEAIVTKLRTRPHHHLFLHISLRHNCTGTHRWGEFGEGGLLWGECTDKNFEWFDGSPADGLLCKVRDLYGLDKEEIFRNVTVSSEKRPQPLYLGAATQIGCIPTEGIPSLLKILLPSSCTGLPVIYMRDLLLNPPMYPTALSIQESCKLMSNISCPIPEFTVIPATKLVKLLESKEANHIEFCRIKNVVDDVLYLYGKSDLNPILQSLLDPTWVATGLKIDCESLVNECRLVSHRIGEMISLQGERVQATSSVPCIPGEFFEDVESSWKGRVKEIHTENAIKEVERAAESLSLAVTEDFLPIVQRVKAVMSPHGGPRGDITYAKEHEAVWFKGKRFVPSVWGGTPGEEQIKRLIPATDSKGKNVGDEWFTTEKVEVALNRYHEANARAKAVVMDILRGLSTEMQIKINVLVYSSMLLVIAKALFAHVSEGRRRKWVFPTLKEFDRSAGSTLSWENDYMEIVGLSPYWFDAAQGNAIQNTVKMHSLFILTGPNGGGKSSLLRSICAAALLGICGLMVPAVSAVIPHFDSIMLHMKSYDSPADGKSSFQMEMSELRSIVTRATARSLVLVDEICRGTEMWKGTCIAGSILETLDNIGCVGIVSTHIHALFNLPLATKNIVSKAMGTEKVNGRTKPTWKLIDGICRESLAFETAQNEGIPEAIIRRAEELYLTIKDAQTDLEKIDGAKGHRTHQSGITCLYDRSDCLRPEGNESSSFENVSIKGTDIDALTSNGLSKYEDDHAPHDSMKFRRLCVTNEGCGESSTSSSHVMSLSAERQRLLQNAGRAVTIICQRKLNELYVQKCIAALAEISCVTVDSKEQPPPSTIGTSSVYVLVRPDLKLYVGQTDDLIGRVRTHRSSEGMQDVPFLYVVVPGRSVACLLETLLINQLPLQGFHLSNKADGKHRNFGTCHLTLEGSALAQ
ncbi:hypothetical protein AMTRI_Chr07g76960 [Amborella trichopoda]